MKIKNAKVEYLPRIMDIINHARLIMRQNGNTTQWTNGYPSEETILSDIAKKQAFVCVENELIVGYFCFIMGAHPEPTYSVIDGGAWLNDEPYGVLHRIASSGMVKGVAKNVFDFAFCQIRNVRVDTNHDNMPMQNFLQKNGFTYCGIIYVHDGSPRDAFQKEMP